MKEIPQVYLQELNENELTEEVSKPIINSVKNRGNLACPGKSTGVTWEIDGLY